jgi:uncharacterized protein (TIGR02118 family)
MGKAVAKLLALYNVPEADRELFDQQFTTHVPLVKKMPGLRSFELIKNPKNMMGGTSPYYLIGILTFDDMASLKAAMSSPEGQEAGNNIMSFASNYITMLACEADVMVGTLVG